MKFLSSLFFLLCLITHAWGYEASVSNDYSILHEIVSQPLDHFSGSSEELDERVVILIPKNATADSPVMFMLGEEASYTDAQMQRIYRPYSAQATPEQSMIWIYAEHRGFGESTSHEEDQTVPLYVTSKQVLADFHAVAEHYKKLYRGPWIAAGWSYSGGLAVSYAGQYPGDVAAVLSVSGGLSWEFTGRDYDRQTRINLGEPLYDRVAQRIEDLSKNPDEQDFVSSLVSGISQYKKYSKFIPLLTADSHLPAPAFYWVLRELYNIVSPGYNLTTSYKKGVTREDIRTGNYDAQVWNFLQCSYVGVLQLPYTQPSIITDTSVEQIQRRCQEQYPGARYIEASENPDEPLKWVNKLQVPLLYVWGSNDPWNHQGLLPEDKFNGKFIGVQGGHHCPDVDDGTTSTAHEVLLQLLDYVGTKLTDPLKTQGNRG